MSVILVVSPHPDDETLGCGGTLLRHKAEGDDVHWLIMSGINVNAGYGAKRVELRRKEIREVAEAYGFSSVHQLPFIAAELDVLPKNKLVRGISEYFVRVKPDTVYVPNYLDAHSDHEVVFSAIAACTKSFRYPYIRKVRVYEVLSETEFGMHGVAFQPNLWVDISEYIERKIEIMRMYEGEMGVHPFPRSEKAIRALACLRGARANRHAAEAFMILEEIT